MPADSMLVEETTPPLEELFRRPVRHGPQQQVSAAEEPEPYAHGGRDVEAERPA